MRRRVDDSGERSASSHEIFDLAEQLTQRFQADGLSEAEAFIAAHPEHAERLRSVLPMLEALAQSESGLSDNSAADAVTKVASAWADGDERKLLEELRSAAQELAADSGGHPDNRPLQAQRPAVFKRISSLPLRQRAIVTMAIVPVVIVLSLASISLWRERSHANRARIESAENLELALPVPAEKTALPEISISDIEVFAGDGPAPAKIAHQMGGGPTLADFDKFGRSVASLGDLDGDGIGDLAVGAFGDDTGGSERGAVYVLFPNSDGTIRRSTKIAHQTGGGPTLADGDVFGNSLASMGDLDGDGIGDLVVGARCTGCRLHSALELGRHRRSCNEDRPPNGRRADA